jgi:hypothetical protein
MAAIPINIDKYKCNAADFDPTLEHFAAPPSSLVAKKGPIKKYTAFLVMPHEFSASTLSPMQCIPLDQSLMPTT